VNDVEVAHVIAVAFAQVLESETYHWKVERFESPSGS